MTCNFVIVIIVIKIIITIIIIDVEQTMFLLKSATIHKIFQVDFSFLCKTTTIGKVQFIFLAVFC